MIGDVLTSSILFEALRQNFPHAQLDYLINEHTVAVVQNNPNIDNFVFFDKEAEQSKRALYKLAKWVRNQKYDVVIDVYSKISSNIITLFSGAKTKISYHKYYTSFLYTHNIKRKKISVSSAGLAIENRLQLLEPLNIEMTSAKPEVHLSKEEIAETKSFLEASHINISKPLYMISVLGSSNNKTYPFEYMATIINTVVKNTNGQILFNYIPHQKEEAQAVYDLCKPETKAHILFDVFGKNLRHFIAITYHCDALIGNEGGAINMAKALNIRTFTIFSPWIDKTTWSVFEDENNVSVHLKDFMPEIYGSKTEKEMKNDALALYNQFKPSFFIEKLKTFLD